MAKHQSSQWWRWPLIPFAAIVGGLLGAIAFVLLQWLLMKIQGDFHEDGWMFRYILPVISSAVFGWLYVYITFKVAPKGKFIACVVMTTILGIVTVLNIGASWYYKDYSVGYAIKQTVGSIASFVAAIVCLIQMKEEEERGLRFAQLHVEP